MASCACLLMRFLVAALAVAACTPRAPIARAADVLLEGETMGSTYHVKVVGEEDKVRALHAQIDATLERINDEMSTYRPHSEISRFNKHASTQPFPVSAELAFVTQRALDVGKATNGAYDITIDPLIDAWGFDRSGKKSAPPTSEAIAAAKERVGLDRVSVTGSALVKARPDVTINLGGIAAGFAVDVVAKQLEAAGFTRYMVEITGEVRAKGTNASGKPWRIGVKVPDIEAKPTDVMGTIPLVDQSVTTSGSYHNFFVAADGKKYSHILDPTTGAPIQTDLVSVTVLYQDALTADGFDTAFVILGEQRAREVIAKHPGMQVLFIYADGRTSRTDGFPIEPL